jgi:hypothetical protein
MAGNKFLTNNAGTITEVASINSSAGATDANKVVSLNASGILDATIVNSKTTSVGSGDSGKLPALDASGRLDTSFMPTGIAADTAAIITSEALSAGDLINIWNNAGAFNVRKADASTSGKEAMGYVLSAVANGANATVYFEGSNTAKTGLVGGKLYLSTTAGGTQSTAPIGTGQTVQVVGFATAATVMNCQIETPIVLA